MNSLMHTAEAVGLPIQKSPVQRLLGVSPRLIAAYHVFHRLLLPRHPPYALSNLFFAFNSPLGRIKILLTVSGSAQQQSMFNERTLRLFLFDLIWFTIWNLKFKIYQTTLFNCQTRERFFHRLAARPFGLGKKTTILLRWYKLSQSWIVKMLTSKIVD